MNNSRHCTVKQVYPLVKYQELVYLADGRVTRKNSRFCLPGKLSGAICRAAGLLARQAGIWGQGEAELDGTRTGNIIISTGYIPPGAGRKCFFHFADQRSHAIFISTSRTSDCEVHV
jgi:hypothetical protein